MVSSYAALSIKSVSEKSVEKADFTARPANGYTDFSMKASLVRCGAPANRVTTAVFRDGEVEVKQVRLGWLYV